MAPGDLIAPGDLEVDDLVQARDPGGHWYNAKVIKKTGRGANVAVKVTYVGFSRSHDEKFTSSARAGRSSCSELGRVCRRQRSVPRTKLLQTRAKKFKFLLPCGASPRGEDPEGRKVNNSLPRA